VTASSTREVLPLYHRLVDILLEAPLAILLRAILEQSFAVRPLWPVAIVLYTARP